MADRHTVLQAGGLAALLLAGGVLLIFVLLLLLRRRGAGRATDPLGEQALALGLLQQQVDFLRADVSRSLESQAGLLDRRMAETSRAVSERLDTSGQTIGERLDGVARTVGELRQQLGQVQEASQRIFEVGRSIAGLQDLLRSPKLRGGLGELLLGDLLGQILPQGSFILQHGFRSGAVVDAAIRAGRHIVPVDAKFPLENFRKILKAQDETERRSCRKAFIGDVRKHIDSIAEKYIRPQEGTFDFALMYIPAENVYYETILRDGEAGEGPGIDLFEHAINRRVVPVSPNSFYAYLQVILVGLRGMRIEEGARLIVAGLDRVSGDLERFRETFELVGKHLNNASRQHESAFHQLERVEGGFESLRALSPAPPSLPASSSGDDLSPLSGSALSSDSSDDAYRPER